MYLQVLLWAWCMTWALNYRHSISSPMLRLWRAFVILWIVIMIIVLQICVLVQLMSITSSCQGIVCLIWPSQYFVDKTYSKHTKECFCFAAFGYLFLRYFVPAVWKWQLCVHNATSKINWCSIHLLKRMKWCNYFKCCPVTVRYYLQIINLFYQLK